MPVTKSQFKWWIIGADRTQSTANAPKTHKKQNKNKNANNRHMPIFASDNYKRQKHQIAHDRSPNHNYRMVSAEAEKSLKSQTRQGVIRRYNTQANMSRSLVIFLGTGSTQNLQQVAFDGQQGDLFYPSGRVGE